MAKHCILLAVLIVGGFAFPAPKDDLSSTGDDDMSMFFDHTVSDAQGRIVGGTTAGNGAFPWMAALITGNARTLVCGGSIVNARRVLTAAHCITGSVSGGVLRNVRVLVGTNTLNRGGQIINLQGHNIHPHYNPSTLNNDVAVLRTSTNIATSNTVRFIPLSWDHIGANVPCRVSGWGRTSAGGPLSNSLIQIALTTFDAQRCVTEVQRVATNHGVRLPAVNPAVELCTFVGVNRGTCNGDSGSPLVRNSNNQQIGIVSWGLACARGAPDMFARVSAFRSWLLTVL